MHQTVRIGKPSSRRVIFGHGLGDSPAGWADVCKFWQSKMPSVEFILPAAPIQAVSLNMGMKMPSWYDIPRPDQMPENRESMPAKGIDQAVETYLSYVVDPAETVFAGFSQGGAVAIWSGVEMMKRADRGIGKNRGAVDVDHKKSGQVPTGIPKGIIAMSGYVPHATRLLNDDELCLDKGAALKAKLDGKDSGENNNKVPSVIICHGTMDPMVPYKDAKRSKELLEQYLNKREARAAGESDSKKTLDIPLHSYQMAHEACDDEIQVVLKWLQERFPEKA